jgi:8-oxo-dGTP diphosphatase
MLLSGVSDVTAAVIERDGCVLLTRRGPGRRHTGLWEFPGGRVESGESPEACLARELSEELGINARVGRLLGEERFRVPDSGEDLRILFYAVTGDFEGMVLRDHDKAEWVAVSELASYPLVPADRVFVNRGYLAVLARDEKGLRQPERLQFDSPGNAKRCPGTIREESKKCTL